MEEIWKDIEGYGTISKYQISNYGRIRTLNYDKTKTIKVLKTLISNSGYEYIILRKNGKKCTNILIHRLVAEAFIPNPNCLPCVNHKDENKLNNNVNNLEWCSYSYNNSYGKMKTKEKHWKPVKCVEINKIFKNMTIASKEMNIGISHISSCCNGRRKTTGGYHWEFVN